MLMTTAAIAIHALRYGEADLIVKLYTRQSGLRSYLLRGILKSKKAKIRASLFQPLSLLEIEANHKDKGTLEHLKDARLIQPYRTLHTEIIKSSVVLFLSEILKSTIQEEEENESLYIFLENSFLWFDNQDTLGNFHLLFLLNLTKYLGFYPDDSQIEARYFNLLEGYFQPVKTNDYCVTGPTVQHFQSTISGRFK